MRKVVTSVAGALVVLAGPSAADAATNECVGGADVNKSKGLLRIKTEVACPEGKKRPGAGQVDRPTGGVPDSSSQPVAQLTPDQMREIERREALRSACARAGVGRGPNGDDLSPICGGSGLAQGGAGAVPADTADESAPTVTVAEVRESAIGQLQFGGPKIGASPCVTAGSADACTGTVGVPVWLWVGDDSGALPSDSASATAGPYSITATAKVSKVKWSLGDGQSTICQGTGTAYDPDVHGWSSPHCGFESGWKQPGTYTLTASYVWDITWSGDQTGSATQTMSTTRQVTVGELQSVVTAPG